jgi:DNA-binding IclR family transcriptional regulator
VFQSIGENDLRRVVVVLAGNSIEAGRTVAHKISSILLTFTQGGELSLSEIARLTGLPISTAHRLTAELARLRLLERKPDGMWRPGLALRNIGAVTDVPPSLTERAPCILEDLVEITKCRTRLGVWRDLDVGYIEVRPGAEAATSFTPRAFLPAPPTAVGRALLAFSSPNQVDRVISGGLRSYTEHTITSPPRLRHALAVTRLTRVAVSRREFEPDIYGVAMPVFGPGGHVIAAIEIAAADLEDDLPRVMPPLVIATRSLSRELAGGVAAIVGSTARSRTDAVEEEVSIAEISTFVRFGGDHATRTLRKGTHAVPTIEEPHHDNDYRPRSNAECG